MALKKYTQAEFDALPTNEHDGKICPTGDYTEIQYIPAFSELGDRCTLGNCCKLGNYCTLGNDCTLGNGCKLGDDCTLGNCCKLGDYCTLGGLCTLGNGCTLGNDCKLGNCCKLGNFCTLGDRCKLGNCCTLCKNISFESWRVKNGVYLTCGNIGSENRTAYFYADETGKIFVRAGCWFSDMDEFITRVKSVHGGTMYETQYLAACEYAKAALPAMLEKERAR